MHNWTQAKNKDYWLVLVWRLFEAVLYIPAPALMNIVVKSEFKKIEFMDNLCEQIQRYWEWKLSRTNSSEAQLTKPKLWLWKNERLK